MDRCRLITKEFKSRALGEFFAVPVDPVKLNLKGYTEIVTKPMDFSTITNKLENNRYRTPKEWYDDMNLVFQNAIDYYPPTSCIYLISKFYQDELNKISYGLNITSESEWIKKVNDATNKLTKCFLNAPSFQNCSSKVAEIKNKLDSIQLPDEKEISIYIDKLNSLGSKTETKCELYDLFKEIGHMPPQNLKTPIDMTKLPTDLVKSLIQYAKDQ
ncbi:hypothetical protein M9Y10_001689 [Tritrichomonas musculus]|uniref:Bromo domain-containing protein n=1 Tax=Tritrichomonas musculus TaxID=1915356 RepID=A0ABR2L7S5_9EUKA